MKLFLEKKFMLDESMNLTWDSRCRISDMPYTNSILYQRKAISMKKPDDSQ